VKPAPFEYHAPTSVADAVALLAEYTDEAKPLAGGQSLVPMLALRLTRFEHLVDLNRIGELRGVTREDGTLTVKAMTSQREVEHSPEVAAAVPLLARATPYIGHFQIRNRGTVGGNLAHADPASELPAVALALDAEFEVASVSGSRRVPASEFFIGTWTTALESEELLTAIHFPALGGAAWGDRSGFAVEEVARRSGDFALAGAVCAVALDGSGNIARAGIGLFGMGATPERARAAEESLVARSPSADDLAEIGRLAVEGLAPTDDIHASAAYRRRVGAYLVQRVLGRALEEARG